MNEKPLYKQIQQAIKDQIRLGNLRPGDRIPSEKELAEQFHVSLITTKNALAGLAEEGVVVRAKGKGTFVSGQSAFMLHMPPSVAAGKEVTPPSSMHLARKDKSAGIIGMIIPSMRTKVEQRLLDAIENAVNEQGYTLAIRVSRGSISNEREAVRQLFELGISGLVLFPIGAENDLRTARYACELGCPLALIDRYYPEANVVSVSSDNRNGARMAVKYVADAGMRSIALLTPPEEHSVISERLDGYKRGLAETRIGMERAAELVMPYEIFNVSREQALREMERWMMPHHKRIDAVIALDVELARLAYYTLQRIGAGAKTIVTFDDPEIPGIAFIQQDESAIGRRAVAVLMDQITLGRQTAARYVVPVRLVVPKQ
nr:GntR family transcriptional regulator [Paenibacillus phyllosphaerae]